MYNLIDISATINAKINTIDDSVSKTIQEIFIKERKDAEKNLKIRNYEATLATLDKQLAEYTAAIHHADQEYLELQKNVGMLKCEKFLVETQTDAWRKTSQELKATLESSSLKCENYRKSVWSKREEFCTAVMDFTKSHGLMASTEQSFDRSARCQLQAALHGTDLLALQTKASPEKTQALQELEALQNEAAQEEVLEKKARAELDHVLLLNRQLDSEYEGGAEFMRLRNALKDSSSEQASLQVELQQLVKLAESNIAKHTTSRDMPATTSVKQRKITDFLRANKSTGNKAAQNTTTDPQLPVYQITEIIEPYSIHPADGFIQHNRINAVQSAGTTQERSLVLSTASRKDFRPAGDVHRELALRKQREESTKRPNKKFILKSAKRTYE